MQHHALFAEDVLAVLQALEDVFIVEIVGGGDVHRVDVRALEHLLVAAVARGDVLLLGEGLGALQAFAGHRRHLGALHLADGVREFPGDVPRPHNAELNHTLLLPKAAPLAASLFVTA